MPNWKQALWIAVIALAVVAVVFRSPLKKTVTGA